MSITQQNIQTLRRALETYATVPADLVKVDALAAAASANLDAVLAEREPSLDSLSVKTLAATTDALTAWASHDDRVAAARKIAARAAEVQANAWFHTAHTFPEALRPAFEAAAKEFTQAYGELDGHLEHAHAVRTDQADARNRLSASGEILRDLESVRALLGYVTQNVAKVPNQKWERPTRVASFPDVEALGRRFLTNASALGAGSLEWFAAILDVGGTIRWNSVTEQEQQVAAMPRYPVAYTVGAEPA